MKIQPYVEKLNSSEEYKKFLGEHKDAFLIAGFFVLDFQTNQNLHQIDFYVPSEKKIAAFTLDEKINFQLLQTLNDKVPEKLDIETKTDLDELKGILEDEMKNRNITEEIVKIIAVIQTIEGKKMWNLNCVLSGMEILNAHVEDNSKTVLKMEKKSIMELMKKMPEQYAPQQPLSREEAKDQIAKLEKLKEQINEKEKELAKEKGQN